MYSIFFTKTSIFSFFLHFCLYILPFWQYNTPAPRKRGHVLTLTEIRQMQTMQTNKNTWRLRTTNYIGLGKRPKKKWMWVKAECLTSDIQADTGNGLNFLMRKRFRDWFCEEWVENLDELPDFSSKVYEELYTSPWGEIEVTFESQQ